MHSFLIWFCASKITAMGFHLLPQYQVDLQCMFQNRHHKVFSVVLYVCAGGLVIVEI